MRTNLHLSPTEPYPNLAEIQGSVGIDPVFSIVVPVYNEAGGLNELYRRVCGALEPTGEPWELILVNDGSRDGSPAEIARLCAADRRVRGISLSRNFGFQAAVTAGLDEIRGQAVILMDADLQDPPEVIPELIAQWRAGSEVVYGVRGERAGETWFKRVTAGGFYRLMAGIASVDIPLDTGDFRLMDRRVAETLRHMPEHNRFLRGMVSWVGFKQTGVIYQRQPRYTGKTKFTLQKMVRFAFDAIAGFSYLPLQLGTYIGVGLVLLSLAAVAADAILGLTGVIHPGAGFDLLAAVGLVGLIGGIQLTCLGILGEYLGRVYDEVRQRPLYLVEKRWGFGD
jgi:polyisoprenyl-phosphate glycosyltransferase